MSGYILNSTNLESTACPAPYDGQIYSVVAGVAAISALLSLLACCFIISIITLLKKYRCFCQRLILYLAIATILKSLATILQRVDYNNEESTFFSNFCVFSGFFSQTSGWMVLNSVVCITLSLLTTAFFNTPQQRLEPLFIFLIFIFPITINWIPFIDRAYGRAGPWCWIRFQDLETCQAFKFGLLLQLLLWYIPIYAILSVLIILYVVVLVKIHRMKRKWTGRFDPQAERACQEVRQRVYPLLSYPLIYFLLNIPILITHIQGLADPNDPQPALWLVAAAAFPLEGALTAVAFSLDPSTRRRLTWTNLRAAISNFGRAKITEYPVENSREVESSTNLEEVLLQTCGKD